jgi:hypothetical protein
MDDPIVGTSRLDEALTKAFSQEHLEYLESRGYCAADVMAWAWILKTECSYEASLRLFMLEDSYKLQKTLCPREFLLFNPAISLTAYNIWISKLTGY